MIQLTAKDYRTRFKTSRRKLPKLYPIMFSVGEDLVIEVANSWSGGMPQSYTTAKVVIDCMDEYAIVCKYIGNEDTILIIDWKSLNKGQYRLYEEIDKRIALEMKNTWDKNSVK